MSKEKLFWKRWSGKENFYYWNMVYDRLKKVKTET